MAGIIDHVAKRIKLNEKMRKLPFMECVLLPDKPVPMPYPLLANGVAIVTRKYCAEIVTDANGEVRFITTPLTMSMYRTINIGTGVHTLNAGDALSYDRFGRLLHHSCKFTYTSVADTARGIAAIMANETDDPGFATWNESAAVLGGRIGAVSVPLSHGFYAWSSLPASWTIMTQGFYTWRTSTTRADHPYIKVSISNATPLTTIGRIEITSSYELASSSQFYERRFYKRTASELFEVLDLCASLNIPNVFDGLTYLKDINDILDEVDKECRNGKIEKLRLMQKDEVQSKLFQFLVHAV